MHAIDRASDTQCVGSTVRALSGLMLSNKSANLHGSRVNIGLEGRVVVGQVWQCERHDVLARVQLQREDSKEYKTLDVYQRTMTLPQTGNHIETAAASYTTVY
jgi:hypothetical protein